jgi:hypothetical protein
MESCDQPAALDIHRLEVMNNFKDFVRWPVKRSAREMVMICGALFKMVTRGESLFHHELRFEWRLTCWCAQSPIECEKYVFEISL